MAQSIRLYPQSHRIQGDMLHIDLDRDFFIELNIPIFIKQLDMEIAREALAKSPTKPRKRSPK